MPAGNLDRTTRNNYRLARDQDRCTQVTMCRCHLREEFVSNLAACSTGGHTCYIVATLQILPLLPGPLAVIRVATAGEAGIRCIHLRRPRQLRCSRRGACRRAELTGGAVPVAAGLLAYNITLLRISLPWPTIIAMQSVFYHLLLDVTRLG